MLNQCMKHTELHVCRWSRTPVEHAIATAQQCLAIALVDKGAKLRHAFQRDMLLEASRDANLGVLWLLSSCAADMSLCNYDRVSCPCKHR
jgi:hypothetical protein